VVLADVLLRRVVGLRGIRFAAVLVVAAVPALSGAASMVWTEVPFVAVVLGCLACVGRSRDPRRLAAAAVLVGPAFLLRYVGLVLIPVGAVTVVLAAADRPWLRRAARGAVFVAVSAVVPVGWLARNRSVSGTLMGPRPASTSGLATNTRDAFVAMGSWVIRPVPSGLLLLVGVVAVGAIAVLTVLAARRADIEPVWARPVSAAGRDGDGSGPMTLVALATFSVAYAGYLVAARTVVEFDRLDSRLMLPLLVPLVVLGAAAADGVARTWIPVERRPVVGRAAGVVVGVWLLSLLVVSANDARLQRRDGAGYAGRAYADAALLTSLRASPPECELVSNDPEGLWYRTGLESTLGPAAGDQAGLAQLVARAGATPVCLVWIDEKRRDYLLDPAALGASVTLVEERRADGGAVFRVESRSP